MTYGTRRFKAEFTGLSKKPNPESIQFLVLTPISLIYFPILSLHLRLGFPKALFHITKQNTRLFNSIVTEWMTVISYKMDFWLFLRVNCVVIELHVHMLKVAHRWTFECKCLTDLQDKWLYTFSFIAIIMRGE